MIELRHLRKEFEDVTPLEDINVTIHSGDVISVIGPSPCCLRERLGLARGLGAACVEHE